MMSDLLGQRMFVGTSTSKTDEFVRIPVGICITYHVGFNIARNIGYISVGLTITECVGFDITGKFRNYQLSVLVLHNVSTGYYYK